MNYLDKTGLSYFWNKIKNKVAASGGTDLSLVTTGEKYNWDHKTSNTGTVTKVSTGVGLTGGNVTTTGTIKAKLKSETASTLDSASMGSTANRQYAVGVDKSGYLSVNVPWKNDNTTYTGSGGITLTGTNFTNSGVRSIATGSSNGTISVNTNGTSANVSVKGLKALAYKDSLTASDVGAIASTLKGAVNGVAELDANGLVPSSQLPSYVDDIIEGYYYNGKFYKESTHTTEITGETGKIYVDLTTEKTYRYSGSGYVEISASLALGETSSTAYRGDRGKTAYNHSQVNSGNPHNVTASDVGLGNVGNFKAVSTVASQGLTDTEKSNARTNIGAGTSSLTLGNSSTNAYYGDKGKTAYDHSQVTSGNPHNVTKSDVGLENVGNFKAVSTVASQGLTNKEKSNARANIGAGTSSLALGTTSSTAYRGDYGGTAYRHATDSSKLKTAKDSGLYKVASTSHGHIASLTAVEKSDITALGIPAQDTTYESKEAASGGTDVSLVTTGEKYNWNESNKFLSNLYSERPTSANITTTGDGKIRQFKATGTMTTGNPPANGTIIHLEWDNTAGYSSQLCLTNNTQAYADNRIYTRSQSAGVWGDWEAYVKEKDLFFQPGDVINYYNSDCFNGFITSGGTELHISITVGSKRMDKVKIKRPTSVYGVVRGVNGYVFTPYNGSQLASYLTAIDKSNVGGIISFILTKSDGWGGTNNTPIIFVPGGSNPFQIEFEAM